MKKIFIATAIALAAASASAVEVGVVAGRGFNPSGGANAVGVTVGQHWGKWSLTGEYDRVNLKNAHQNRWSVVGGYDLAKVGPVTVTPKLGAAYLDNPVGSNGYATLFGVGATLPVTKNVAVTADLMRQQGQNRVEAYNNNSVVMGVKYTF